MAFIHSPKIVTDGLALYLDAGNTKSYPGSGTTWRNLGITGSNALLINAPTFEAINNGSLVFNGVNQTVSSSNTITGNNPWSVCIWTNISSSEAGSGRTGVLAFAGRSAATRGVIAIGVRDNAVEVNHGSGELATYTGAAITFDTFQNICVTYAGSSVSEVVYLNGIRRDSRTLTNTIDIWSDPWYFASQDGSNTFLSCKIAQVLVYNRTLSAQEILQNFNAIRSRFGI